MCCSGSTPSLHSVLEMERQLRLNEDVLRFMTIRVEEIEEAPSAILSRTRTSVSAVFAARSPPGGSRADAVAVSMTARNSGPGPSGRSSARSSVQRPRSNRASSHACPTRRKSTRRPAHRCRGAPPILSPPQVLPVLRPERAEDRLQGRALAVPLPVGARQDRAFANHGGFRQKAARARDRDQACAVPCAPSLHRWS